MLVQNEQQMFLPLTDGYNDWTISHLLPNHVLSSLKRCFSVQLLLTWRGQHLIHSIHPTFINFSQIGMWA